MRHRVKGRHLGRTVSHRRALRRNLASSLFEHGSIRTTEAKGKDVRRFVEKLITTAKKGTLHARRRVIAELQDRQIADKEGDLTGQTVVQKLLDEIAPRYADRPGGYTRIIRLPERRIGDAGRCVILQLVEEESVETSDQAGASKRRRRAEKRIKAAGATEADAADAVDSDRAEPAAQDDEQAPDEPAQDDAAQGEQADKE